MCWWQVIAALKTDKDELESHLYDIQQVQSQLETKKEQLEMERQELVLKKEHLSGWLLRLERLWVGLLNGCITNSWINETNEWILLQLLPWMW